MDDDDDGMLNDDDEDVKDVKIINVNNYFFFDLAACGCARGAGCEAERVNSSVNVWGVGEGKMNVWGDGK